MAHTQYLLHKVNGDLDGGRERRGRLQPPGLRGAGRPQVPLIVRAKEEETWRRRARRNSISWSTSRWTSRPSASSAGCAYGSGEVGEILSTVERIIPGDFESWVVEWKATAERVEAAAGQSAAAGNQVSARRAYLRAASYYSACLAMIDGS